MEVSSTASSFPLPGSNPSSAAHSGTLGSLLVLLLQFPNL